MAQTEDMQALLDIRNLTVNLLRSGAPVDVLQDVSFSIQAGRVVAVVGESGCGKSITASSIVGLLPPSMQIASGQISFDGEDLVGASERRLRQLRAKSMAMVFQDPMTSLNPLMTIGRQLQEAAIMAFGCSTEKADEIALSMLQKVGIPDAVSRLQEYPHSLSGGMRQRVMIAMALCRKPKLLIADEPTTALDVTIQLQILRLLADLQAELSLTILIITHNLGVVAELADDVVVMYAGKVVESGGVDEILKTPKHPYTRALLAATPRFAIGQPPERIAFKEIKGTVPELGKRGPGCRFEARCPASEPGCAASAPETVRITASHIVACRSREMLQ
ncbi:ABC transporter ATP-binding protein [Ferrovibrio sp.]|uniref:ABC transporter ATP-binding protein n=1 Tax=Ferrovibrio sp. TaxID=1917215 RepID=UPI0025BD4B27|nr:ABC transporter ATP-binding protein [Ferrovibrio sp.]MBX3452948.1 ABC transporter ATP-binding protein [Ferrovibrio sp.]